jgi:hypothetical protein
VKTTAIPGRMKCSGKCAESALTFLLRGHMRGERMNDGLSAVAVGEGRPLVVLPGLGRGADLSVRVPRTAAWSNTALASGFKRTVHLIHRPVPHLRA